MSHWERNQQQHPAQTGSRFQPGIMVNMEFGVSFSANGRPHTANINYASRSMQEKLARQHRQEEDFFLQPRPYGQLQPQANEYNRNAGPHPAPLMPNTSNYNANSHAANQNRLRQQHRSQRLGVRTREQHERGSSAPPSFMERTDRLQPISPVSPIGTIGPLQHTSSMPLSAVERPLPALPSTFRLGEDGLPWSTEPWYQPTNSHSHSHSTSSEEETIYVAPTMVGLEQDSRSRSVRSGEDPQRVRELETLHQAMMTVDSLAHEGWDPWAYESVGDFPRGPRGLGWAVSTTDSTPANIQVISPLSPGPPPYVVSQYEQQIGRYSYGYARPMSSG